MKPQALIATALLLALGAATSVAQACNGTPDFTLRVEAASGSAGGPGGYKATLTSFAFPRHFRDIPLFPASCSGLPGTPVVGDATLTLHPAISGGGTTLRIPMSGGGASCALYSEFDLTSGIDPTCNEPDQEMPGQTKMQIVETPEITDLGAASPVQVGPVTTQWGTAITLLASQASKRRSGQCYFRYRYVTINNGPGVSEGTENSLTLNSPTGQLLALDLTRALESVQTDVSSGLLALPEGQSMIVLTLDAGEYVPETSEGNNLRRLQVNVQGSCN
jgi:hypothetical protein